MDEFIIFCCAMLPSIGVSIYLFYRFFKDSILFQFGVVWVITQGVLVIESYGVGKLGKLSDFIWAFPIGMGFMIVGIIYLYKRTKPVLLETSANIDKIAKGDLKVTIDKKLLQRSDEIGIINNSVQSLLNNLHQILESVQQGSSNLQIASEQLQKTAQQISEGSNEQASSLEEIASTMEEIASNIASNTQNASATSEVAKESSERIRKVSNSSSKSLVSVKKIVEKISFINDISFQTNILALNAAVEASRAGEHGRGFAVVSGEVRKLAENSKKAADEIALIASDSMEITNEAATLLNDMKPDVEKTSELVSEIASASIEQHNGADQVNNALQQLNGLTQQNATISEEMAAGAEELSAQASTLNGAIGFFKL